MTGGRSGIGRAVVELLEREGAEVRVLDLRDGFDVADAAAWEAVGGVDLACLNAGVTAGVSDIARASDEAYRRILRTNVDGVVFGVRRLARVMAPGGAIVVTVSLAGLVPTETDPLYALTKHALVGFVRSVAPQLERAGIRVNAVAPGYVDTPLLDGDARAALEAADFPLLRAEEVAEAVLLAARDEQTGQVWICQPGREPLRFRFPGVPGPRVPGREGVRPPLLEPDPQRLSVAAFATRGKRTPEQSPGVLHDGVGSERLGAVRPLDGFTAVSLAVNVPGPVAAARLHALGAAVTKVEPPDGDPLARSSREWYDELAAGQRILRLDLKEPTAREELDRLLEEADVLLTAQRPAGLARLGLVWDELHGRFPRLCWVAIVGHPEPDQDRAGHDLTYLAKRGLLAPPELPRTMVADLGGAERAVGAALAALLARERGDEASYVEVALAEAADLFAEPLRRGLSAPGGSLGGGLPVYGLYETSDGWIAVAALEPAFRRRLAEALELPEPTRPALERAFRARRADEWEAWALDRDLPIEAVRDP